MEFTLIWPLIDSFWNQHTRRTTKSVLWSPAVTVSHLFVKLNVSQNLDVLCCPPCVPFFFFSYQCPVFIILSVHTSNLLYLWIYLFFDYVLPSLLVLILLFPLPVKYGYWYFSPVWADTDLNRISPHYDDSDFHDLHFCCFESVSNKIKISSVICGLSEGFPFSLGFFMHINAFFYPWWPNWWKW